MSRHSLVCVGSACGAIFTLSSPLHAGFYAFDDGSSEDNLGLSGSGEVAAIHAFSTIAGQETIVTISMAFGTPASPGQSGLVGGETLKVYLWSDTDGDGDPSNGGFALLNTIITTVSAGSIDTDIFQNVVISPTLMPATGFFIGYAVTPLAGTRPLSRDTSHLSMGRAWIGGDTTGNWDPILMAGDIFPVPLDVVANAGFPGVWLLRASGEPSCPWDCQAVPQSGAVDVPDLLALLGAWGGPQTPGTTCDFDGSGAIAVPDLLQLLANWGPCPPMGACCDQGSCSRTTQVECAGTWLAGSSCADSDVDGIPDDFELDDCSPVNGCFVGTDPFMQDTDGDGINDGDEVFGTVDDLDLPALGANPLHKDIFIEMDWMDDSAHTHRPTANAIDTVIAVFAAASDVQNPCGTTGIAMHIDRGQGGVFTGGNFIGNDTVIIFDSEFNTYKAAHFDPARKLYFHYCIHAHRYNTSTNNSSGFAELPGDDFVVTLQTFLSNSNVAKTIMHELGHNLLLRHGGFENRNFKPNYNSVMNYRFDFPGVDTDCDGLGNNVIDYSFGLNIALDESALDEAAGVCGATPIDWNGNAVIDGGLVARNINCSPGSTAICGDNAGGACVDSTCNVLLDFNDWTGMAIPIPAGTDFAQQIIFCQDTPGDQ